MAANAAPKGFKKVETAIAGFWKPAKVGQSLQGVVGHQVETKGADGKANVYFVVRLTSEESGPIARNSDGKGGGKAVKPAIGMLVGVGGRTLQTFLKEREGREVFLSYAGLGEAKRGQNPPKLYETFEAGGDEA